MKLISELADKTFLGGAVFFAVHWIGKVEAFTVMTSFALSVSFLGMLKLFFMEPRPFFCGSTIRPATCKDLEYGFPSGHATTYTAVYFTLYFCTVKKLPFFRDSLLNHLLLFALMMLGLALVCFSRLFLGVHSLD